MFQWRVFRLTKTMELRESLGSIILWISYYGYHTIDFELILCKLDKLEYTACGRHATLQIGNQRFHNSLSDVPFHS